MTELLALDEASRVVAPEGKTLEYKRDLSSPAKLLRSIVAFANAAGGRLVVGIADDGSVVGVGDPLAEEERLANLIADKISPQLVPAIDLVTVAGLTVLVVEVPLSTRRPHFIKSQGLDGGVYVRLGSTTRQADPALVAELERTGRGIAFEDLAEPRASLSDLDLVGLSKLRGRKTTAKDLGALGLAFRQGSTTVPTIAGILVACPEPSRFLPSAWVQCGRLRGPAGTDIFDQLEIHKPLPSAVDEVMAFLSKHAYKSAVFGEARRKDIYSIPVAAIREVVINALVHASYAERGTPIRVGFYDDRVVVESPGGLVSGLTVDTMRGVSRLRNPSLARVFRDAGLIEQWGSGVNRVFSELAKAELPAPEFEEIVDRVRVTIHVGNHSAAPSPSEQVSKSSEQVSKSSEQVVKVLRMASSTVSTRRDLLAVLGLTDAYGNYRRHLVPLIESGLLARTIPDKPNSRLQRYVATAAGKAFLEAAE